MTEARVPYSANQPTPLSNQSLVPSDPTAAAIALLVEQGYTVTVGGTGGELRPYHVVVYKSGLGAMVNEVCSDFRAELLRVAGVEEDDE